MSRENHHEAQPLVSVVIVNWNRCDDVVETLTDLQSQTYQNIETIVVDNGSVDDSIITLEEKFPEVKLIKLPINIGCEDGFNVGILNSLGEIILFLDSDASIEKAGITKLVDKFTQDEDLGIVGPRIRRSYDNKVINEPKFWPISNYFTACVVAFRASVFKKIGLRPGDYFIYASEPDIGMRAIDSGFKILHCKDIEGFHRESPVGRLSKKFYYYNTRNYFWLIWKHYPPVSAVYETLFLLVFNFIHSLKALAFFYYIHGLLDGLIGLNTHVRGKRKVLNRYNEARLFPGPKDLFKILALKFSKK